MPMLHLVRSKDYKKRVRSILKLSRPSHAARMWMVGYLQSCGYSIPEIQGIIDDFNTWKDYDADYTEYMLVTMVTRDTSLGSRSTLRRGDFPVRHVAPKDRPATPIPTPKIKFTDTLNKPFFWGAREVAIEFEKNKFYRAPEQADPQKTPIFRSIEGMFHVLWVADFDDPDLKENLSSAKAISKYWKWDFVKYTGNKSIHMVKKLPHVGAFGHVDYGEMKKIAGEIEKGYGVKVDHAMFKPRQLIRGYCLHHKTGKMGCPVDLWKDTAETIEARSEQFTLAVIA